jgi:uroporphyrinogen-III synthase
VRVAVTRPWERAAETEKLIRRRGWEPIVVSSIELVPISIDPVVVLSKFDWLVVTSASGVDLLWRHFKDGLKEINIAVVGPKTAAAFENHGINPKLVARESVGEGLAKDLLEHVSGRRVLVARAKKARTGLVELLSDVAEVTEIAIYDSIVPRDKTGMKRFKSILNSGEIDAIVFTSSLAARNLLDFIGEEGRNRLNEIIVCAIGPVTAGTLEEWGIRPNCIPRVYTIDAALDEISKQASA